ncbi:hypothetical protein [Leeia speluncae]|nr:hypothetical protein [Leeia speluncae]
MSLGMLGSGESQGVAGSTIQFEAAVSPACVPHPSGDPPGERG